MSGCRTWTDTTGEVCGRPKGKDGDGRSLDGPAACGAASCSLQRRKRRTRKREILGCLLLGPGQHRHDPALVLAQAALLLEAHAPLLGGLGPRSNAHR